ncbi:hypothetical protein ABPG75_004002 [Micractinium tetrahymenae]
MAAAAAAAPSQWTESCVRLERVCVDQGSIILYGASSSSGAGANGTDTGGSSAGSSTGSNAGGSGSSQPGVVPDAPGFRIEPDADRRKYDGFFTPAPIRVRPASADPGREGAAYLRQPIFSRCTVPVVWYSMWPTNFAHMFRDNAAKLWGVLRRTPWARHLKLALVTAEELALPGFSLDIFQPMLQLRVESWADFSARLPSRQLPDGSHVPLGWPESGGSAASRLPLSWEGGAQRCFEQLFVCHRGLNITSWPLHGLGQHLVQRHRQQGQGLPPQSPRSSGSSGSSGSSNRDSSTGGSSSSSQGSGSERVLRVVFLKRSSPDRQLLDTAELLERCSGWRGSTAAGQRLLVRCSEVAVTNLAQGIAVAQEADVLVSMHGANLANGWLLWPGSAVIELQSCGFDAGAAHLQYPLFNLEDGDTQVQWWLVSACDPAACTPGVDELHSTADEVIWARNRNLRIGWEPLAHVLQAAAEVAGDMAEYRRRWQQGRWWWWLGPGGELQQVGPGRFTKMRCPAPWPASRAQSIADS